MNTIYQNAAKDYDTDTKPFMSIRAILLISFAALFLVVYTGVTLIEFYGIPFTSYRGLRNSYKATLIKNLDLIADLKKERLLFWLQERKNDITVQANSSLVRQYAEILHSQINEGNFSVISEETFRQLMEDDNAFKMLTQHLNLIKATYRDYERIFLADVSTKRVLASTRETDVGKTCNLDKFFSIPSREFPLVAFEKNSQTNACEFCCYYPIKDTLAIVACFYAENLVGPLLYTGYDLGESGEVVLVNQDRKLLAPLKHPLPDGSHAEVLEYEITGIPATLAAQGRDGSIVASDYRGVPVLAAYRHIHVTPELLLGMVVKCDVKEVYAEFYRNKRILGVIVLCGVFVLVACVFVITGKILSPVERLSKAVEHIRNDNFHCDVAVPRWGETRRLAIAFNAMLYRMRNWNTELEAKVQEKTVSLEREIHERKQMLKMLEEQIHAHKKALDELEESREKFIAISVSAQDAIILTDDEGNVVFWNNAAERIFGYSGKEAVGSRVCELIIPYRYRTAHIEGLKKFRDTGQGPAVGNVVELYAIGKDGKEFPIELSLAPVRSKDKWCAVGVIRDISRRVAREESLRLSNKMASLGQLTAGIFHEILNPINIISTHVQLLLVDAKKGSDIEKDLRSIQEEIKRIQNIMDGLLKFSRKESVASCAVDVHELIEKVLAILVAEIKYGNIQILKKFDSAVSRITVNPDLLRQVFLNLIKNAIDAMERGGSLTISTRQYVKDNKPFLFIQFTDTGCGIPKEHLDKVFDPFFSTKNEGNGLGMGLTIAYSTIQHYGGSIQVASEAGKGSTFTIELPVQPVAQNKAGDLNV